MKYSVFDDDAYYMNFTNNDQDQSYHTEKSILTEKSMLNDHFSVAQNIFA